MQKDKVYSIIKMEREKYIFSVMVAQWSPKPLVVVQVYQGMPNLIKDLGSNPNSVGYSQKECMRLYSLSLAKIIIKYI